MEKAPGKNRDNQESVAAKSNHERNGPPHSEREGGQVPYPENTPQGKLIQKLQAPSTGQTPQGKLIQMLQAPSEEQSRTPQGKLIQKLVAPPADKEELASDEGVLQKKSSGEGSTSPLSEGDGPGSSLPKTVRSEMENAFRSDFSGVRIHTESIKSLNVGALAFTQGNRIHFSPGQYRPESQKGKELARTNIERGIGHNNEQSQSVDLTAASTQCCGDPLKDLLEYAKRKTSQFAYDATVAAGRALIGLGVSYIENKLDDAVNSEDAFSSSVAMTTEFITGLGPEEREFGADHPFTQSLAESNMTTEALKAFNKGYEAYLAGDRSDVPSSYRVDFKYGMGGDTGPFKEFFKDGKFTAAQFTGTANYTFSLDKNGNLDISVYDTKTEYSFLYHLPGTDRHSRVGGRIMGETTQHYNFSISLNEVRERAKQ